MIGYSSPFYHQTGPDLLARFYLTKREICRIELSINSNAGLTWQMMSDESIGSLEDKICDWMVNYAEKKKSSIKLPLLWSELSPFTQTVLKAVSNIPCGQTLTYKEVAEKMGNPRAPRAVGNACGRNPFLLVVPCHRVLAAGSLLGGFSAGPELKKNLLHFEEIVIN